MSPLRDELDSLLFDWESGTLDEVGIARLREILRSDAEARRHFVRQQMLGAALRLDVDSGLPLTAAEIPDRATAISEPASTGDDSVVGINRLAKGRRWWAIAASLLVCVLGGRMLYLELATRQRAVQVEADQSATATSGPESSTPREATSNGIALLTRAVDLRWGGNRQNELQVGDAISPGGLSIAEGYAQIEFFCGATVVVEGPAEIDLKSSTLARVHRGRFRAHVPPAARGFSIEVDDMTVVDLGTEFALEVSDDGTDVQVFDGEVELHVPDQRKQLLEAGQAIATTEAGGFTTSKATPDRFVDIASLEARAGGERHARFERWQSWSKTLRRDPRLIAYYTFDQVGGWKRTLQSSREPVDEELDGAIVGASRVRGRWQEKSALEFKRPGDRVRVSIPGEFDSLTFACWVKIDSLDRWYNSLFLTDAYNQGEPHWQILDTGQLFFSVRHKPDAPAKTSMPTHQPVLSPPFWKPSMSGRWLHLATTYAADDGRITHYLNGKILHQESIEDSLIVTTTRLGTASIGNWSIPTRPDEVFAIRNLNGRMDEFAIFAAALSANEIQEMYLNGKP
ncbi:MAG: LamG-like jellyroll fold domain-containing protein [Planctomycetota bacterium]